ncbi:hypothetical protein ACFQO7_33975 [Catellatospora aurea]|uniref:Uncharacterized protein n=1 Tax=Catellatospora aurea TaxID=1337874 RepID=A0ABW2H6W2_9ACTN
MVDVAFDVNVGMFLCAEGEDLLAPGTREQLLTGISETLRGLGLPEHCEPRVLAEIDPPLEREADPCLLGVRLGFYGSEKYQRLAAFAQHLAVHGTVPSARQGSDAAIEQRYNEMPDRRLAFDHVIAVTGGLGTIVLPQPFDEVIPGVRKSSGHGPLVSAHRLRIESVALAYALRYVDVRDYDWIGGSVLSVGPFSQLDARVEDDPDVVQAWADEADLCHRLLKVAVDILRTGALGITS